MEDYFVSMQVLQKLSNIKKLSMLFYVYESHHQDIVIELKVEESKQSIKVYDMTANILDESLLKDSYPLNIRLSIKSLDGIVYMEEE